MAKAKKKTLNDTINEILQAAEQVGAEQNYLFVTTLKRYQDLIRTLNELNNDIRERGAIVDRTFASGKSGLDVNTSINLYNSTTLMANKTAETLMAIIRNLDGVSLDKLNCDDDSDF
jgi:hypothetical protein